MQRLEVSCAVRLGAKGLNTSLVVGMAYRCTDYPEGLDDPGVRIPAGAILFPFSKRLRSALGPNLLPTQWVQEVISRGVKRHGHEAQPLTYI